MIYQMKNVSVVINLLLKHMVPMSEKLTQSELLPYRDCLNNLANQLLKIIDDNVTPRRRGNLGKRV